MYTEREKEIIMTKEQIAELIGALPQGLDADEFIYKLVNWALDIEREECAKLVEEMGIDGYGTIAIGLAIRERK